MRAERGDFRGNTVRLLVADELDRIQWEGRRAPWMAAMDTQTDGSRVTIYRGKAERASTEVVTFPGTES